MLLEIETAPHESSLRILERRHKSCKRWAGQIHRLLPQESAASRPSQILGSRKVDRPPSAFASLVGRLSLTFSVNRTIFLSFGNSSVVR